MAITYCPSNDTVFKNIWVDHGISRCFIETFSPLPILILVSILAIVQFRRYLKGKAYKKAKAYKRFPSVHIGNGVQIDLMSPTYRKCKFEGFAFSDIPKPFLYICQWLLHFIQVLLALSDIIGRISISPTKFHASIIVQDLAYMIAWSIALKSLERERRTSHRTHTKSHSWLFVLFWSLGLSLDCILLVSWNSHLWWFIGRNTVLKKFELWIFCIRLSVSLLIFFLAFKAPGLYKEPKSVLITGIEDQETGARKKKSAFNDFFERSKQLWPFLWPKDRWLQLRVVMCLFFLGLGRAVNVFSPLQYKKIVNYLTNSRGKNDELTPYKLIAIWISLQLLQGGGFGSMGILNNLRSFVWIRVQQFTSRAVQVQLFSHLHGLSLSWHLKRKTGEVLRMVDRGATSIDSLLSYILFSIAPTIVDIIIAIIFFATYFNGWFALIVFITMTLYMTVTIIVTEWRTKFRRDMNEKDNSTKAVAVDSLLNFETVKYYNNEVFEVERYQDAILDYQSCQWKALGSLNVLNTVQNLVITCGMLSGTMYCAHMVMQGKLEVGDFVLFITYLTQLYIPLNFFGTYYRMIQAAFIDMENMFDLLSEEIEVKDVPDATIMQLPNGNVEFRNVNFGYDSRPILKDVSFAVPAGNTVALVGPSGSGKSTIIRLLFRFYDVQAGRILIDDQDISLVNQSSLRQYIGVVPQDTVLFNDSVRFNIRYGRVDANDDQIYEAAKSADIHERVVVLKDGYETVVGERGLKLSGGEKQRVAIARTILKAPSIILLDEATSALDTQTERNIQASLDKVSKNRTTIVVAHRLSTVVNADQIIVLKDGVIVERGRHEQLLELEGQYAAMWMAQLKSEKPEDSQTRENDDESGS